MAEINKNWSINPSTGNSAIWHDSPNYKRIDYLVECYNILFASFRVILLAIINSVRAAKLSLVSYDSSMS